MTRKSAVTLPDSKIPTITWKQLWAFVSFLVVTTGTLVWMVAGAQNVSEHNNAILKEMQVERKQTEIDRKDYERLQNIRLTNIELDQREAKIRLTVLETNLNK